MMDVANANNNIQPQPIFIFGDSTMDVGTNNFLSHSEARADVLPNGIDYPYSIATGRFSNGLNTADQIGMQHIYIHTYIYTHTHNTSFSIIVN